MKYYIMMVFYKKSIVEKAGFNDERIPLIDDWPLWMKLTKQGYRIYFCNEILVKYRQHSYSITNENKGIFTSDLHRKERLVYRFYIAPNIGFFRKTAYRFNYLFNEILYRFFNSEKNRFALSVLKFLRLMKYGFRSKKIEKNPKHLAFFMQDFDAGGIGTVFLNYIRILKPLGYTIDVIVARNYGVMCERFEKEVRIINLGNIRQRHAIFRLRKQIKNSSISTLISGCSLSNFIAILATFGLRKTCKTIVTQHCFSGSFDELDTGFSPSFFAFAKRNLYKKATHVVAVSLAVAEDMKKIGVPEHKITVLYNPIFPEKIKELSEAYTPANLPEKYVVFVGRLVNMKNVDLLLDAFMQIEDNDLHLLILGDGINRLRLEEKAQSMKSRIHFLGIVENPMPYIRYAKVVAVPSFSEVMPMVVLESLALEKTIVYAPSPGCVEILSPNCGYGTPSFDNPKEFAEMLKKALEKPINTEILNDKVCCFDAAKISQQLGGLINLQ